jgi:predicted enzyme related to lactoylglutathione lyase
LPPTVSDAQVNLYSADPEALAIFYKGLGLTERFRFPPVGKPDQLELQIGSLTLGLTSKDAIKQLAGLDAVAGSSGVELVLWCSSADAVYARALDLGATSLAPPRVFDARIVAAWFQDSEGNRVKLVSKLV